jgi:(1->4)-alpha-D-glucan 1-alpha-D-glucosylmutase
VNIPIATYRVQFNSAFNFNDLKENLPYLAKLGISHVYASPIFQDKQGSAHGYDVIDHNKISDELGGERAFKELMGEVKALGLNWLQDIVPNHASYSLENKAISDLWENGIASNYAHYFDVDWQNPLPRLNGKILIPFLTEPYSKCLKEGQFSLSYDGRFKIRYKNMDFPVSNKTSEEIGDSGCLEDALVSVNHPKQLDKLLSKQNYSFSYWKTALRHINYRRFFDVIDLIGLRQENPATFEDTHHLIFRLAREGLFSGLRVDHIDGLYQPEEYLHKLRQELPNAYLLVEKILTDTEPLPQTWPVEGTTGYDFLSYANKLFVKSCNETENGATYTNFTGNTQTFSELICDAKQLVIQTSFLGDVQNLSRVFHQTLKSLKYGKSYKASELCEAIMELMACFPVYRTYLVNINETPGC